MIGETIKSVDEHHDNEWIILEMKSGRRFEIKANGYYGGEADLSLTEIKANKRPLEKSDG